MIASAEPSASVQQEVKYLLGYIENSRCEFYRNGSWSDSRAAQAGGATGNPTPWQTPWVVQPTTEQRMAKSIRNAPARRSRAYTEGLKIRRRWLGKAYVDKAFKDADDFTIDVQHWVTEHGWGASWARGGLPLKTRAFMNLAMISALNRPHELEVHLRAAIRNGMTRAEIKETFLHVAVYCGAPAALDGFRIAKQIFAERR